MQAVETALWCLAETPHWTPRDEAGFNGQTIRRGIFQDLVRACRFETIVETGTWIGESTGYLATATQLPVHSCELNRIYHTIAKLRLKDLPGIHLSLSDSRSFLARLATTADLRQRTFFYLDAHWHRDLPLAEEIDLIAGHWQDFAIMVDDFQVPGDDGYGYDDYGRGRALTLRDFSAVFARHALAVYFPARPATEETGRKRGSVVLVPERLVATHGTDSLPSLVRARVR